MGVGGGGSRVLCVVKLHLGISYFPKVKKIFFRFGTFIHRFIHRFSALFPQYKTLY